MKLSELKKEITITETTTKEKVISLPDNVYACPHCAGSGEIEIGHRDGWSGGINVTGPIMAKCGVCQGTKAVVPCKKCGFLMPDNEHNRKYRICFDCYTKQHIRKLETNFD